MSYLREIKLHTEEGAVLFLTDDPAMALELREEEKAVLLHLTEENRDKDLFGIPYVVENPEEAGQEYYERVYKRFRKMPWNIVETQRCVVREMIPEDAESFWELYQEPDINRYMHDLHDTLEMEKAYIQICYEKVYSFYEFGIWTILEKKSGKVIGKAGFSIREDSEIPSLGYMIGVPWQRQGLAEEVCKAIIQYGFEELYFDEVEIVVETTNLASLKLAKKLGFQKSEEFIKDDVPHLRLLLTKEKVAS